MPGITEVTLQFECTDLFRQLSYEAFKTKIFAVIAVFALALIIFMAWKANTKLKKEKEVTNMDEFYRQSTTFLEELEKDFEERVKEAEKVGHFDMVGRSAKLAEVQRKMQKAYLEAKDRINVNKKRGFFSR